MIRFYFLVWTALLATPFYSEASVPHNVRFELLDNRIFVEVFLNGKGPFKFIFDTGGNNSMTPAVSSQLRLTLDPAGSGSGAGEDTQKIWRTKVKKMQIGSVTLRNQDFLVMDYSKIQRAFLFPKLDGVFGFELLQKFVTVIDFERSIIEFYKNPKLFKAQGFSVSPFTLNMNKPFIATKINGIEAKTLIDTGDRSSVTVTKAFRENQVVQSIFEKQPVVTSGYGIGGPIPALLGRLHTFELGPKFRLDDVAVRAPTTSGGFNSVPGLDASIGNEVLKQFTAAFDYRNLKVYLRPNAQYGNPTLFHPISNPD